MIFLCRLLLPVVKRKCQEQTILERVTKVPNAITESKLKGKVWSKMKLHRLVVSVKDRKSAIFLKAKKDFLT